MSRRRTERVNRQLLEQWKVAADYGEVGEKLTSQFEFLHGIQRYLKSSTGHNLLVQKVTPTCTFLNFYS